MTIYVENANDILLKKVKLLATKTLVTGGSFTVSICEANEIVITSVTVGATTVITTASDIGIENGDTVLVRRVRGAESANGFFTASSVSAPDFTISSDTSLETYEGGGQAWKVLLQEATFTYDETLGHYVCTLEDSDIKDLVPDQKYMLFIEEPTLQVRVEFEDTAKIREKG